MQLWEELIMMVKSYESKSVYDAVQERFHYLFHEFENIYVSFSGGKDSGVLLNLLLILSASFIPHAKSACFIRILKHNTV